VTVVNMKSLEERMNKVEEDLVTCGVEKDLRINTIHADMTAMHKDMGAMKGTIELLTEEIKCAVTSLRQIATNTQNMHELVELYDKWKGFAWVMKNIGFWGALIIAFIVGAVAATIKLG